MNAKVSKTIKTEFNGEDNKYTIKIDDKTHELTRAEAVELQNKLTKILKSTPVLDMGN